MRRWSICRRAGWSAARVVASNGLSASPVTIVDYQLPRMQTPGDLKISAGNPSAVGSLVLPGQRPKVEIYDWSTAGWSAADLSQPFLLSAGMRGPDLVRLRVQGNLYLPGLQVTSK